jgi:predicted enzyme related to lactoylglutathione lyase
MSTVRTEIGRFVWHDQVSADPEAARAFYGELLGWETEIYPAEGFDYPMIKVGESTHGGFGPAQEGVPAHWLCHVVVDDADAAAERVEAGGGSIVAPAMDIPDIGRMVVVADPQGAMVSLYASFGDSPPAEGVFVWDELMTTDVEAAKRFYGDVVGWETRDQDMGEGTIYTLFSSGGVDRAGCMARAPGADEVPPSWSTYIGVDEVDTAAEKARSLGATILVEPFDIPTVGRMAFIADPPGAAVGLFKPVEA